MAQADLDYSDEYIITRINGQLFDTSIGGPFGGHLFASGGNTGCKLDGNGGVSGVGPSGRFYMDASVWNSIVANDPHGNVRFDFSTPPTVACIRCDTCECGVPPMQDNFSWVQVRVEYDEIECIYDSDCDDEIFCNGEDYCDGNGRCQKRFPCQPGEYCCEKNRICNDVCCEDTDYEGGYCDPINDVCLTCMFDRDCPAGEYCYDQACRTGVYCTDDNSCVPSSPKPCVDYACVLNANEIALESSNDPINDPVYSETGTPWNTSNSDGCAGDKFRYICNSWGTGTASWTTQIGEDEGGPYDIIVGFRGQPNYATNVKYEVEIKDSSDVRVYYGEVVRSQYTTTNTTCVTASLSNPDMYDVPGGGTDPEDKYLTVSANGNWLSPAITGSTNMPASGRFFAEWAGNCTPYSDTCNEAGRSLCDGAVEIHPNRRVVTVPASIWNSWLGASGNT